MRNYNSDISSKALSKIGKQFKKIREERKMTQEELAQEVGLSTNYLSAIERGVKIPRLETFLRITNVLGVSADILLADTLCVRYQIKSSLLGERMETLPEKERERIFHVLEVMLQDAEK